MSTTIDVARAQLLDRRLVALPWGLEAVVFAINLILAAATPGDPHRVAGVVAMFAVVFVLGVVGAVRQLPFALALGATRRAYYLGTVTLVLAIGAADGLALAALQAIERATGGWGVSLRFFRLAHVLDGSWPVTWLTAAIGLVAVFGYGMWFGLVYRRWELTGLIVFVLVQAVVLVAVGQAGGWGSVGHALAGAGAVGTAALLAGIGAVVLAGGWLTVRRVAV